MKKLIQTIHSLTQATKEKKIPYPSFSRLYVLSGACLSILLVSLLGGYFIISKAQKAESLTQDNKFENVLGTNTQSLKGFFNVNVPATFNEEVIFKKGLQIGGKELDLGTTTLKAENVLYSLAAGEGLTISSGQSPTITNTGVTSLQNKSGALTLEAGSGISIDGLKITNTSQGSDQDLFKTIAVGSSSFSAGSTTDTLTLAEGTGITLAIDATNKKITINGSSGSATGWSLSGSNVSLSDNSYNVGVGTSTPTAKLEVNGASTGKALVILNQTGDQNILSASTSGVTKFAIDNTGAIVTGTWNGTAIGSNYGGTGITSYTQGDIPYYSSGTSLSKLTIGGNGYCLTSNGTTPTWGSCQGSLTNGSGSDLLWTQGLGALSPGNSTVDFLVGGTATTSAKFGVLGVASDAPVASLSASNGNGASLSYNGILQATNNQSLQLGGTTTGNIVLSPHGGTGNIQLTNFSTNGGLLYTNGAGTMAQTGAGAGSQCLLGGTTPSWGSCSAGTTNTWQENSGVVAPANITDDLAIGGISTTSAIFQVSGTTGAITMAGSSNTISTATAGKWSLGSNSFTYRRTITVTNNDGALSIPSGYQVTLNLSGATATDICNNTRGDNNDIRVASSTPSEIARNITRTCGSSSLSISFLIQSTIAASGTGTYYLYYSNSSLASSGSTYSYTPTQIDSADNVATWTASDAVNTPISQDTSIKDEGTGSVKIATVGSVDGGTGADGTLDLSLGASAGGCNGTGLSWNSGSSTCTIDTSTKSTFNFTSVNVSSGTTLAATGTNFVLIKATGTVTFAGTVSVSGNGQTSGPGGSDGGAGGISPNAGTAGSGTGGGGGGPHDSNFASGGCGGGFGGTGGKGGSSTDPAGHCTGGTTYSTSNAGGSGGGGGGSNSATGGAGGGGGGSFQVAASGNISVTGTINTNGGNAPSTLNFHVGGGGGGSGGSVGLTSAGQITGSGTISANGGAPAGDNSNNMKGGGGGGGRITLSDSDGANSVAVSVTGGGNVGSFGLTAGSTGVTSNAGLPASQSLNDTVILTTGGTDLSSYGALTVWVRSATTGTNFTFGYGVSAITEHTASITVNSADTWEQKTIDISGTSPRSAITKFGFTVTTSNSAMNFWFDDLEAAPSSYAGSAPTLTNGGRILGASNLSINSQGSGGIQLNYDATNGAAGSGGLTVYNGASTTLFAVDSNGAASQSGGLTFSSVSSIQTTANQTLTIGGTTTGNIILSPLNGSGFVGIGTTAPKFTLDVAGSNASSISAQIVNSDNGASGDVLALKTGATTPGTGNYFLTFLNGNGGIIGKVQGNGSGGVTYSTNGIDFAEYYHKQDINESFEPGDIVCLGDLGGAVKCSEENTSALGVISDRAGFVGGSDHENDPDYVLVGIVGQLPVKVAGTVNPGDLLTASNTPGIAQKAMGEGFVVGRALEANSDSKQTVKATLSLFYKPAITLDTKGNIKNALPPTAFLSGDTISKTTTNDVLGATTNSPVQDNNDNLQINTFLSTIQQQSKKIEELSSKVEGLEKQSFNLVSFSSSSAQVTTIDQGLFVSGPASFDDVSVQNNLSIGNSMKITGTSIDTINEPLSLQPLRQGALDIMGGYIVFDTDGKASFKKDVSIEGVLSVTSIKGLSGAVNISGSAQLENATVNKLHLGQENAGTAVLSANEKSVTIETKGVTSDSLIFITPTTEIPGQALYISGKSEGQGFSVSIPTPIQNEIRLNYLIIN